MKVKSTCENLLLQKTATIRIVAQVIGFLVSSFPAVVFAEMHYRHLELDKICALRDNKGNFNAIMTLSTPSRAELTWCVNNVPHASKAISHGNPDLMLTSDVSNMGWGAVCGNNSTGGLWSLEEERNHITYLELKAVLLGLQSLCTVINGKHILVQSDDTNEMHLQEQPTNATVPHYMGCKPCRFLLSLLSKPTESSLKSLTLKPTMLIALVSAQRGQSLHMLEIQFMKERENLFEFALPEHIKQSIPGDLHFSSRLSIFL